MFLCLILEYVILVFLSHTLPIRTVTHLRTQVGSDQQVMCRGVPPPKHAPTQRWHQGNNRVRPTVRRGTTLLDDED